MSMDEAAVYYHELYCSFVRAGFASEQALTMVVALLSASVQFTMMGIRPNDA